MIQRKADFNKELQLLKQRNKNQALLSSQYIHNDQISEQDEDNYYERMDRKVNMRNGNVDIQNVDEENLNYDMDNEQDSIAINSDSLVSDRRFRDKKGKYFDLERDLNSHSSQTFFNR